MSLVNNFILTKIYNTDNNSFPIKAIEVQNCGITDAGGRLIIDCLNRNKTLAVFEVNCNPKISKKVFNEIQRLLGAEPDTYEADRKESTTKLR